MMPKYDIPASEGYEVNESVTTYQPSPTPCHDVKSYISEEELKEQCYTLDESKHRLKEYIHNRYFKS